MHVGDVINKIRKDRKMTLVELSEKSGVAVATLSRIENGKMAGTLDSHMAICKALGIVLPELYKDLSAGKKTVELHTKGSSSDVFVHSKQAVSEMLGGNALNKHMMPTLIKINKNGVTHKEETKAGVEKFIYVLDGKVEASIAAEKYNLTKGDTLYFDSSSPHHFKNTAAGESRLICVISPPAL